MTHSSKLRSRGWPPFVLCLVSACGIALAARVTAAPASAANESVAPTQSVEPLLKRARGTQLTESVPAPETVLGFTPGERPVRHHEAVAYYEALASTSDRVKIRDYGRTSEGRRLFVVIVSAPENLARLETIQSQKRQLGDEAPAEGTARSLIANLPATAWMGYGIHGDEISGPDAAIELAYRLAAGTDEGTQKLLRNVIVHLDPMFNADGRERSLAHTSAFRRLTPNEDTQDLSHFAFWPSGRGNHYLFDLNRDALYTVQQEARSRVAAILDARPQFMIDAHEMESDHTFLFAVPAEPLNPLLPASVHQSWRELAADHAAAFDRDGTSYYSRSWNEDFYPGYFDIWPAYLGAVPMIYEQAATAGTTLKLPNGLRRSYAESVEHQLRSSLANLQTVANGREAFLSRWAQERRKASQGGGSARQAWLILPGDAYKTKQAATTLRAQGLTVEVLRSAVKASDLHSTWDAEGRSLSLPAGTLLVRAAQPLGALAHNLLDLHVPMPADFLKHERRGLDLDGNSLLYDTTAWSLPHAYAADVLWSGRVPAGDWRVLNDASEAVAAAPEVVDGRYGYLYRDPSLFATARLLERGVKVRVARKPFTQGGASYERGTFLIRNDDQESAVIEALRAEQKVSGASFVALGSARILEGPDLGDEAFQLLTAPRIAVIAGAGTESLNVGAMMHLFDSSIGVPFTLLDLDRLGDADLSGYNVIVMPDVDDEGTVAALLKADRLDALKRWVEGGGTLVALRGGADVLAGSGWTTSKLRQDVIEKYPPLMFGRTAEAVFAQDFVRAAGASGLDAPASAKDEGTTLPVISPAAQPFLNATAAKPFVFPATAPTLEKWLEGAPAADALKAEAGRLLRRYLPHGSYLSVELKPTHWLAFGVPSRIPSMFRESEALIADGDVEAIGRYAEPRRLALSGLVWPEAVGYIAGTAHLVREKHGAGQVILFANDPVFRGYSLGTQRLFLNATVLGPAFR